MERSNNLELSNCIERSNSIEIIRRLAEEYNNPRYFQTDPIAFPKHFLQLTQGGSAGAQCGSAGTQYGNAGAVSGGGAVSGRAVASGRGEADRAAGEYVYTLKDVEIAGLIAAHLAWGRRDMIVRDCNRAFEEMQWRPLEYVMRGEYRCGQESLHRTIRWSEFAAICGRMKVFYAANESVEPLTPDQIRVQIYGQSSNPKMANKKIHMFRRWMVRNDGIVDLGLWSHTSPADLIIPLDTHVHASALKLGITTRKSADITTALEITEFLKEAFPDDPCKGDFALFAYAAENRLPASGE